MRRTTSLLTLIALVASALAPVQQARAADSIPITLDQQNPAVARQLRDVISRNELLKRRTGTGSRAMIEVVPEERVDLNVRRSADAPEDRREAEALASIRGRDNLQPPHTGIHRKLWVVTAELVGLQLGTLVALSRLPADVTGWGEPSFSNIFSHAAMGPRFDSDPWYWNFLAHPLSGSEYYLLARNRDMKWWQSLLYSVAMSTFWEFVTEGVYERVSMQDLFITPIAGAVLGELRFQLKQALIDPNTGRANTTLKKVLVVLLDPIDGLTRL